MSLNHDRAYNRRIRAWLLDVFEFASRLDKGALVRRKCPVCGSGDGDFFGNNDYLDYERCRACDLVFMNPTFPAEWLNRGFKGEDKLLARYFRIIRRYRVGIAPRPDPKTDRDLRDIYTFKRKGRLLDVGCSVGAFLQKARHFYEVEGVEVNPWTAAVAGKHFPVHRGFLSELRLPCTYDIVTLNQVLYGVPDPVGLLREIGSVLRSKGLLYINTPNADSHAMRCYRGKANHLNGYKIGRAHV